MLQQLCRRLVLKPSAPIFAPPIGFFKRFEASPAVQCSDVLLKLSPPSGFIFLFKSH
jgi:hypothetical protein